mmetsp:Transcript_83972/g.166733  ORF Transcript_83972/g.166733 Transcript_83972/m.166733 type:complete len:248 (-) Transcript_83972:296-1039(-)
MLQNEPTLTPRACTPNAIRNRQTFLAVDGCVYLPKPTALLSCTLRRLRFGFSSVYNQSFEVFVPQVSRHHAWFDTRSSKCKNGGETFQLKLLHDRHKLLRIVGEDTQWGLEQSTANSGSLSDCCGALGYGPLQYWLEPVTPWAVLSRENHDNLLLTIFDGFCHGRPEQPLPTLLHCISIWMSRVGYPYTGTSIRSEHHLAAVRQMCWSGSRSWSLNLRWCMRDPHCGIHHQRPKESHHCKKRRRKTP